MKTFVKSTLIILAICMAGCEETKRVIDVAGNVQLSGTYVVTNMGGIDLQNEAVTLSFAALDKSVRGNTGCNTFFGNYTLDAYALDFNDLAFTEKACSEPIMEKERALKDALQKTGSYTLENNALTLYAKTDRSVVLTATKN